MTETRTETSNYFNIYLTYQEEGDYEVEIYDGGIYDETHSA
jgi:hypothetical protein